MLCIARHRTAARLKKNKKEEGQHSHNWERLAPPAHLGDKPSCLPNLLDTSCVIVFALCLFVFAGQLRTVGAASAPASNPNSSTLYAASQLLVQSSGGTLVHGGERSNISFSGFPPLKIAPNGTATISFRKTLWVVLQGKRALLAVGHSMDAVPFVGQETGVPGSGGAQSACVGWGCLERRGVLADPTTVCIAQSHPTANTTHPGCRLSFLYTLLVESRGV